MNNPAKANQPISSSLNVMGPNPLVYPQSYQPEEAGGGVSGVVRSNYRDSQQQTERASVSTSTSTSTYDSNMDASTSLSPELLDTGGMQHFERLFDRVNESNGKFLCLFTSRLELHFYTFTVFSLLCVFFFIRRFL